MSKVKIEKGSVFERYEKKYLLTSAQHHRLWADLEGHAAPDIYGRHTICSLYYDTPDFAVMRRCLEKPSFRQKLRLRSYGVPGSGSTVYLELKKKMAGITYKRRVPLTLGQVQDYLEYGTLPPEQGQIFGEIDWYRARQPLEGKAVVCYDRIALQGLEPPDLRITFDANIRWRDHSLDLARGDHGTLLLPPGTRLMEVKTPGALPCWLAACLSGHDLYPQSHSKYGSVYAQILSQKEAMRHAG